MSAQYAFYFDSTYCSGCKACQAACKDKNDLPAGVLWRRVYEVSGGTWQRESGAWSNSVFVYNLSMSCNHCVHPKCVNVCPVNAYQVRLDGIVLLDSSKCAGCGYCAWACPYDAPQYNAEAGTMSKCNFCLDQLQQGLPPACVAACPLRVLDYGEARQDDALGLWNIAPTSHPLPLAAYSHTQPRLSLQPHPAMTSAGHRSLANPEEIQPRKPSVWEEMPLVLFTLLAQMAVGGFWAVSWTFPSLWVLMQNMADGLQLLPNVAVGLSLGLGMIASLAHLGARKNAWRILANLRKSWLSREILFTLLFGLGWLFTTGELVIRHSMAAESFGLTSALGLGLIYSMSQVYRLPAAPGWNTWRTNVGFLVTALLLGQSLMNGLLAFESDLSGIALSSRQQMTNAGMLLILLLIQLLLMHRRSPRRAIHEIRVGLMFMGILLITGVGLPAGPHNGWVWLPIVLTVVIEEGIGRWLFYQSRT